MVYNHEMSLVYNLYSWDWQIPPLKIRVKVNVVGYECSRHVTINGKVTLLDFCASPICRVSPMRLLVTLKVPTHCLHMLPS